MADRFKDIYNLSPPVISTLYAAQGIAFILTCFLAPKVAKFINLVLLVASAQYVQSIGAFLIGPS
jgi:hypothetical protein